MSSSTTNRRGSAFAWAAIDTLTCLLLVIYVMVAPPPKPHHPPAIPTFGQYAIVMTWPGSSRADIDLHVQEPDGQDVYFASTSSNDANLEHDDIPDYDVREKQHHERVVIRGVQVGEYTVNAHYFDAQSSGPCKVTVALYRLRGNDARVKIATFTLERQGAEHTAFRFTLNRAGDITDTNDLQKRLVGAS